MFVLLFECMPVPVYMQAPEQNATTVCTFYKSFHANFRAAQVFPAQSLLKIAIITTMDIWSFNNGGIQYEGYRK